MKPTRLCKTFEDQPGLKSHSGESWQITKHWITGIHLSDWLLVAEEEEQETDERLCCLLMQYMNYIAFGEKKNSSNLHFDL